MKHVTLQDTGLGGDEGRLDSTNPMATYQSKKGKTPSANVGFSDVGIIGHAVAEVNL